MERSQKLEEEDEEEKEWRDCKEDESYMTPRKLHNRPQSFVL